MLPGDLTEFVVTNTVLLSGKNVKDVGTPWKTFFAGAVACRTTARISTPPVNSTSNCANENLGNERRRIIDNLAKAPHNDSTEAGNESLFSPRLTPATA
ncbi:MAG: hypothetical protein IID44_05980 [Planctomycetes bacterium]|nr:hypothetical protein [Planctomycetota bacterium]